MSRDKRNTGIKMNVVKVNALHFGAYAFIVSIALAISLMIVATAGWYFLDHYQFFDKIVEAISPKESSETSSLLNEWFSLKKTLTISGILSSTLIVAIPLLTIVFTVLYNIVSRLIGGTKIVLDNQN